MSNERKTEQIVREHFLKFKEQIILEEQKSDNPIITKLLKSASKSGDGVGKPEFIISIKDNPNLLIVIECKADITKHESSNSDNYKDYAVHGALLYSSYLSKEFNVIAIAVSGQSIGLLRISHFLQLKGEKAVSFLGNQLLSIKDYINNYFKSPEKFRQDYDALLSFAKQLNEELHKNKILESQRALLISCILIALENKAFKESYKSHKTPQDLANALVSTVVSELKGAKITNDKLENLAVQFSFIKTDTSLSTENEILRGIIDEIDININSFIKTHEYFDVLGQLYIEFLRYANSDKGLGIVLTPPHITEFFSEIANVNKNTICYDNCAGTGGFLISAMRKMIYDAKGDSEIIKNIKRNQLIGVEFQSHIFALAVSNMYIHQDGKTNIIKGSCFNEDIIEKVKKIKPTVGLLNPPYKADKTNDIDELEFVLSNLECLVEGGICVAIVPMQSALAQSGRVGEYKRQLLEKHTLEAVLSMPDELFFNSDVGVVSCVMVFTAHKPHPKNKETYFGYYKDDGFVKRKIKGRIDAYGKWETIKEKWLTHFFNRKNEAGFSISKKVSANDEWAAEAYLETNYKKINKNYFIKTLLLYSSYLYSNKEIILASNESVIDEIMELNINNWIYFDLNILFKIKGSKTTSIIELEEYGKGIYPYVTTQATNNGVEGFYNFHTEEGNVLTVDSAVLGFCSYQLKSFSASDHVEKLKPIIEINKYIALFLVTIINLEQYRYNYGRKCSQSRMKQAKIKLPTINGEPDFEFMENFIKSLPYSKSL
ncbi:MAG: N-6 DNA methylase [bacterium]